MLGEKGRKGSGMTTVWHTPPCSVCSKEGGEGKNGSVFESARSKSSRALLRGRIRRALYSSASTNSVSSSDEEKNFSCSSSVNLTDDYDSTYSAEDREMPHLPPLIPPALSEQSESEGALFGAAEWVPSDETSAVGVKSLPGDSYWQPPSFGSDGGTVAHPDSARHSATSSWESFADCNGGQFLHVRGPGLGESMNTPLIVHSKYSIIHVGGAEKSIHEKVRKRNASAIVIQRIWRGHRIRRRALASMAILMGQIAQRIKGYEGPSASSYASLLSQHSRAIRQRCPTLVQSKQVAQMPGPSQSPTTNAVESQIGHTSLQPMLPRRRTHMCESCQKAGNAVPYEVAAPATPPHRKGDDERSERLLATPSRAPQKEDIEKKEQPEEPTPRIQHCYQLRYTLQSEGGSALGPDVTTPVATYRESLLASHDRKYLDGLKDKYLLSTPLHAIKVASKPANETEHNVITVSKPNPTRHHPKTIINATTTTPLRYSKLRTQWITLKATEACDPC
jgi:hypothetical protein